MRISLDKSAKRTYTKQIYDELRKQILSGELASGDILPPYRKLSADLGISKNTALAAYDMLAADGMIRGVAGSGFYVESGIRKRPEPMPVSWGQPAALSKRILPDGTINFDNGQPALELFPRGKWSRALSAAVMEAPAAALGYDLSQGRPELRDALCRYLKEMQGITCTPDQIIITSGAKQAITMAAEYILKEAPEVWIEDPSPSLLWEMLSCRTDHIVSIPVDAYGFDSDACPIQGTPGLIIASPARQFPTGAVMPMARRIALADLAERTGAYLLEDNFEYEFRYDVPPASSMVELAPEHVISVGTFSKVMYPSIRIGYMVVPKKMVPAFCEHKRLSDHHTDSVTQLALASFLENGTLEKHIRRMKREYKSRRDCLIQCLQDQFGDQVHVGGETAGMNLVAAFDGINFGGETVQKMLEHGVYAAPVERRVRGRERYGNELILRYSGLTKEELEEGVKRLKEGINEKK